jgi:hypothetical protein
MEKEKQLPRCIQLQFCIFQLLYNTQGDENEIHLSDICSFGLQYTFC